MNPSNVDSYLSPKMGDSSNHRAQQNSSSFVLRLYQKKQKQLPNLHHLKFPETANDHN